MKNLVTQIIAYLFFNAKPAQFQNTASAPPRRTRQTRWVKAAQQLEQRSILFNRPDGWTTVLVV